MHYAVWLRVGYVFGKVFLHHQTHQEYLTSLFFQLAIECHSESHLIHHLQQRQFFSHDFTNYSN